MQKRSEKQGLRAMPGDTRAYTRQRGRPRLDGQAQTAGEVCSELSPTVYILTTLSVAERKFALPKELTGNARNLPYLSLVIKLQILSGPLGR